MKLILELDNPQKLELLIELLKDLQYVKAINIIDNKTPLKKRETITTNTSLVVKPDQPLIVIQKPAVKKFSQPKLDTKSFKFNREELYER